MRYAGIICAFDAENGVQFLLGESAEGDFDKTYGSAWCVRRHRRLFEDRELASRLSMRASYYLGQRYNWAFVGSSLLGQSYGISHSFCSELIAKLFSDLEIPISGSDLSPERVLPVHMDAATQSADGLDVTASYRQVFQVAELSDLDRLFSKFLQVPDARLVYIESVTGLLGAVRAIQGLTSATNDYAQLMDSFKEVLASGSDEERELIMKAVGYEPRSIRKVYGDLIDSLFSIDQAWASKEAHDRTREKSELLHYSQMLDKPMPQLDWRAPLASLHEALTISESNLVIVLTSLQACTEGIILQLSIARLATHEVPDDTKETIREFVRLALDIVADLEPYDNYEPELRESQCTYPGALCH